MKLVFPGKTLGLNDEQSAAVTRSPDCNQRILAAAGSGKTTTLTARISWLVHMCSVPAESIVLVTFSRNAAKQMKQRLESLLGPVDVWIGTFHSLARSLLQKYQAAELQKLYFVDELVLMGTAWLQTESGRAWVQSLRYVVIDEFQDINTAQWQMIEKMLIPGVKVIIVGDDAQNIYTWRGSDVNFILDFHNRVKGLMDDQLRKNYRSTEAIVAAANGVLRKIPSLPWKGTMIAQREGGQRPEVHFFWRAIDEVNWVLKQMRILRKENPGWTFAVLSRINSDLYRFEEALQEKGIQYRLHDVADEENHSTTQRGLDLATLHASKGLEWDCVFLIGCNDETFPTRKQEADIICERRLFYVGVTRARTMVYFSYTKEERKLCRFVREIPSVRLLYTGLARYILSDADRAEGKPRLIDLLGSLDGNRLTSLRKAGHFRAIDKEQWVRKQLFGYIRSGLWVVPKWASIYDKGGDFHRFLRLWVYRAVWKHLSSDEPFHEPALERLIFTLRVYAEEKEFFEQWRTEIIEIVHAWFRSTGAELPAVEFNAVKQWAEQKGLAWSIQDIVKATTVLAKLRGQLRPLRYDAYDLNDFRIGSSRYMVPTEWRAGALRSWRRVSDRDLGWREVIVDLWRLGALSLCAEGRNAALFRVIEMSQHLLTPMMVEFLEMLENGLGPWLAERTGDAQFGVEILHRSIYMDQIDFLEGETLWKLCTEGSMDALHILELATRGSLARQEGIPVRAIGWILPLEGTVVQIELPKQWDQNVAEILSSV